MSPGPFLVSDLPRDLVTAPDHPRRWRVALEDAPECWPFDRLHEPLVDIMASYPVPERARFEAWGVDWAAEHGLEQGGLTMQLSLENAAQLLRRGATIYGSDLEQGVAALRQYADDIADVLGVSPASCRVESIASLRSDGAKMHFDDDYAINVQLRGRKRWRLAPNPHIDAPPQGGGPGEVPRPLRRAAKVRRFPEQMPADAETFETSPGDVVWIPRGWWHETEVIGHADSLAIVFAVAPMTLAEVVSRKLEAWLAQDARWREMVMGYEGDASQYAHWRRMLAVAAGGEDLGPLPLEDILYGVPPELGAGVVFERVAAPDALAIEDRLERGVVLCARGQGASAAAVPISPALLPSARLLIELKGPFTLGQFMAELRRRVPTSRVTACEVGRLLGACVEVGVFERRGREDMSREGRGPST